MRVGALAALVVCALPAADERHLAMLHDAQVAFDRVAHAPVPVLPDASACVQTQAAMLAVALTPEESDLHYRKGFCQLTVAAITHTASAFDDAAREFDRAGAAMMAWLARRAGGVGEPPAGWGEPNNCPESCQPLISTAELWLGWQELASGNAPAAAQKFAAPHRETGWYAYAQARTDYQAARYPDAVRQFQEARVLWERRRAVENPPLAIRLAPPADLARLDGELGAAQILAGDPAAAIPTLDSAVAARPDAWAYFLRARAKELSGSRAGAGRLQPGQPGGFCGGYRAGLGRSAFIPRHSVLSA